MKKQKTQAGKGLPLALKLLFILILIGNIFVLKLLRPFWMEVAPEPTQTFVNYSPTSLTSQFEQMWTKAPIFTQFDQSYGNIHLALTEEKAFLLGELDPKEWTYRLLFIDPLSGEVTHQERFPRPPDGPTPTTIAVNSQFVYVGFAGTQKISGNTKWGAGKVTAYDIETGITAWSQKIGGARSIESIVAAEEAVSVRGNFSSRCYLFHSVTGDVVETREVNDQNCIWFQDGGISYEESPPSAFQATNRQTGEIIWQSQIRSHSVEQPPILTKDVIIARIGDAKMPTSVIALDRETGKLLWEYPNTLGNVTVGNSVLYVMTSSIRVVALDIMTGQSLGEIDFSPNKVQYAPYDKFYLSANNNNLLLVYSGGNNQLFAFRFSP
jgi:outer membrane protein assembly factor BamB